MRQLHRQRRACVGQSRLEALWVVHQGFARKEPTAVVPCAADTDVTAAGARLATRVNVETEELSGVSVDSCCWIGITAIGSRIFAVPASLQSTALLIVDVEIST